MNKDLRIQKIQEVIKNSEPFGKIEIPWQDQLQSMDVYKIPLTYLVYNKYNGRILSRTKSLERQNQLLNPETDEGKAIIEKLLLESNPSRNDKTKKNLFENGQQKVGIITKDGIIIDGNRRVMLLNKIKKFDYFKAVILPVTLEENPLEIEKLETSFQMGEDEKLGYNATEKYLKSKEIYLKLTGETKLDSEKFNTSAIKKIADWMDETEGEIKKYLDTVLLMDEYLEFLEYDGIYTQLDEREDQFLSLQKWLGYFYGGDSSRAFDGYKDTDVDQLKSIAFDYIRIRQNYDGKKFRLLAEGNRENHFFGYENIWKGFRDKHFEIVKNLPAEIEVDFNSHNLSAHLDDRDKKFFESATNKSGENQFIENLLEYEQRLQYNKASDEPEKLMRRVAQTFDSINIGHKSFLKPEVQDNLLKLGDKIIDTLHKKSPNRILTHVISLLSKLDISNVNQDEKEIIEKQLKKIQQLGYNLNKNL